MSDTRHVPTLPHDEQWELYVALLRAGVAGEDIGRAMNGRACDLNDTITRRF
jgi:hypothetical protein